MPVPAHARGIDLWTSSLRVPDSVVFRAFPAETVGLDLTTGRYHGLDPAAGRLLGLVVSHGGVREAAARHASASGPPLSEVEHDFYALCDDLVARGLLEVADARQA